MNLTSISLHDIENIEIGETEHDNFVVKKINLKDKYGNKFQIDIFSKKSLKFNYCGKTKAEY